MRMLRPILTIAAAAGLAACASQNVAYDFVQYALHHADQKTHCFTESPKHLDGVDWAKARVVNVDIRDGEFPELGVDLKVGQPTVLRLNNRDDTPRMFSADEFMDAVALEHVSASGRSLTRPCIEGFGISPGGTAEMRLVPVTAGWYYPEDALVWFIGPTELMSRGGYGVIAVR